MPRAEEALWSMKTKGFRKGKGEKLATGTEKRL